MLFYPVRTAIIPHLPAKKASHYRQSLPTVRSLFILSQIQNHSWTRDEFFSLAKLNEGRRSRATLTGMKHSQREKDARRRKDFGVELVLLINGHPMMTLLWACSRSFRNQSSTWGISLSQNVQSWPPGPSE